MVGFLCERRSAQSDHEFLTSGLVPEPISGLPAAQLHCNRHSAAPLSALPADRLGRCCAEQEEIRRTCLPCGGLRRSACWVPGQKEIARTGACIPHLFLAALAGGVDGMSAHTTQLHFFSKCLSRLGFSAQRTAVYLRIRPILRT